MKLLTIFVSIALLAMPKAWADALTLPVVGQKFVFEREYSDAHMKDHPKQTYKKIIYTLSGEADEVNGTDAITYGGTFELFDRQGRRTYEFDPSDGGCELGKASDGGTMLSCGIVDTLGGILIYGSPRAGMIAFEFTVSPGDDFIIDGTKVFPERYLLRAKN